jgi:NADH-quinone oxidoreductase subunit J
MPSFVFYLLALLCMSSAIYMVFQRQPLSAAFALVLCFLGLAGLYAMLMAPLLAILQVLVYAGAIMALIVFVVMLLNVQDTDLPTEPKLKRSVALALLATVPLGALMYRVFLKLPGEAKDETILQNQSFGGIEAVGKHLFTQYTFPFEVISLMLTVAVVGVVVLAKRRI